MLNTSILPGIEEAIGLTPFITVNWTEPIDNGGSPILGFKLDASKDGSPTFTEIYDGAADPNTRQFKFQDLTSGS